MNLPKLYNRFILNFPFSPTMFNVPAKGPLIPIQCRELVIPCRKATEIVVIISLVCMKFPPFLKFWIYRHRKTFCILGLQYRPDFKDHRNVDKATNAINIAKGIVRYSAFMVLLISIKLSTVNSIAKR